MSAGAGAETTRARDLRLIYAATAATAAVAAALRWPAITAGFHSDDYQQLAMLRGDYLLSRPFWDLFWFGPRGAEELARLLDFGFEPWWTAAGHRLAMLRPLPSALFALDHQLFGGAAAAFHLHSLLWWALACFAAARLFAGLLPARAAALAAGLYALHPAHNVPLAWLANRNTLVATALATLALDCHVRGCRSAPGGRGLQVASWALFALALAGGEYALCLLGYFGAHALVVASASPLRARLLRLAPLLLLACGYLVIRASLGYGVAESGMYLSPGELEYWLTAPARCVVLVADLVFGVPANWFQINTPLRTFVLEHQLIGPELFHRLPDWQTAHVVIGVAAVLAGGLLLRHLARSPEDLRGPLWLATGSLLALPLCAVAAPSARLLAGPALGSAALLAAAITCALARAPRTRLAVVACALALIVHGGLAAERAHGDTAKLALQARSSLRWARDAEIPRGASAAEVVVLSASDFATSTNVPFIRAQEGLPLPRSYRRVSGASQPHQLTVLDTHSFELDVLSSDVADAFAGSIYRPRDQTFEVGDAVRLRGMRVEVLSVLAGNPNRLRVHFDRALSDPQLLILHAFPDGLRRVALPGVGQSMVLPRAAVPWQVAAR